METKKERFYLILTIAVIVFLMTLTVLIWMFATGRAGATDNIAVFLPMINRDVRLPVYRAPYRETPTPAPTQTIDWHGTPTPTPYIICIPIPCE